MNDAPTVAWLFSMIRSGSSIAAYAAVAPFGGVVADEIFGPWVRTGPYYKFPPEQQLITERFRTSAGIITPDIARATDTVFARLAAGDAGIPVSSPGREHLLTHTPPGGRPIAVKMPHDHPAPAEVARVWPRHHHAFLLRNPIDRLSSIIQRGMLPDGSSGGRGTGSTPEPPDAPSSTTTSGATPPPSSAPSTPHGNGRPTTTPSPPPSHTPAPTTTQ